jgi:hypothetical protein
MYCAPVTGFTALHKAAQLGDEQEVAELLKDVRRAATPSFYPSFLVLDTFARCISRIRSI